MFSDYLRRQLSHRGKVYEKLGISRATFYNHIKNPSQITLGELKAMVIIGELDEQKVLDWIYRRSKWADKKKRFGSV